MDVFALGAVVSAVTAVAAAVIAYWQVQLLPRQTRLSVVVESFREARTPEWWEARDWIVNHLTAECPPEQGVSSLPPPARAAVRKIGFLYDNLGVLVVHKVVPEDFVIGFFGEGMDRYWEILKPYIDAECRITGMAYMVYFRELARRSQIHPAAEIQRRLGVRNGRVSPEGPKNIPSAAAPHSVAEISPGC